MTKSRLMGCVRVEVSSNEPRRRRTHQNGRSPRYETIVPHNDRELPAQFASRNIILRTTHTPPAGDSRGHEAIPATIGAHLAMCRGFSRSTSPKRALDSPIVCDALDENPWGLPSRTIHRSPVPSPPVRARTRGFAMSAMAEVAVKHQSMVHPVTGKRVQAKVVTTTTYQVTGRVRAYRPVAASKD